MSEQDTRLCQAVWPPHGLWLCGKPASWEFRAVGGLPYLLCERCVTRFTAPWMAKRLTRLDATEAGS